MVVLVSGVVVAILVLVVVGVAMIALVLVLVVVQQYNHSSSLGRCHWQQHKAVGAVEDRRGRGSRTSW